MVEFSVFPTENRQAAKGEYIIQISGGGLKRAGLSTRSKYAVVKFQDNKALCKVVRYSGLSSAECKLDETIRECIGLGRYPNPANKIAIYPVKTRFIGLPLVSSIIYPRRLMLQVRQEQYQHIEKNVCFLHPDNIKILGVHVGDKVKIYGLKEDNTGYRITRLSRRVFNREQYRRRNAPGQLESMIDFITLDLDGRQALKVAPRSIVVVQPDIANLFMGRLIGYGISLLLGTIAFRDIVDFWLALVIGVLLTVVVLLVDLRARINY